MCRQSAGLVNEKDQRRMTRLTNLRMTNRMQGRTLTNEIITASCTHICFIYGLVTVHYLLVFWVH